MADLTLIVGNQNYSSWSLRPYLALAHTGLPFALEVVPLHQPDTAARIAAHSPAGRVPILRHGRLAVWDSLAILEYLAELAPEAQLWPAEREARATARSLAAEMHSGFVALRTALPMNLRASKPGRSFAADVQANIDRIQSAWSQCRAQHGSGGPFLFGKFGAVDAMFAPVATRFRTYGVPLVGASAAYVEAVWSLPALQPWLEAARKEPWTIPEYDAA
jgi:glutathione S-transferase